MGTKVLAIIYSSYVISGFFVPPALINTLGCKWTLTLSMACYIMYMAAHFHASWALFIPAAVILGAGAAPLWTAKSHYLNMLAHEYARKKGVTNDSAVNLFFGVFYLFKTSSSVWGNIISSQVLTPSDSNFSVSPLSTEEQMLCGRSFCPQMHSSNNSNLERPPNSQLFMLAGVYTSCACIAVLMAAFLLEQLPAKVTERQTGCLKNSCKSRLLVATLVQLKDRRQLLLLPLTVYCGLHQAFFASDYTQAFITCPFGNWWVGYAVVCFGVTSSLGSLLFGKLAQFVGRVPFVTLGAGINIALFITFLTTSTTQEHLYLYLFYAGFWGVADAIWKTQVNGFYGIIFKENSEAAFANNVLWQSVGFILACSYQSECCLAVKVYILLAYLCLGMAGYYTVE
ncbi:protein unc-93 homolog A-like isoform X2 [Watersipora subatra]